MPSIKVKKSDKHQWEIYTVVPVHADIEPSPKGGKGPYVVVFTLSSSQNIFTDDIRPVQSEDGETQLYIHTKKEPDKDTPSKLKIESNSGIVYWLKSKKDGQVNILETDPFIANSFEEAATLAYNNASPFLSQLSYMADTAIALQKIDIAELQTGSQRFICLPKPKKAHYPFSKMVVGLSDQSAQLLAEYREARNASVLPLYQLFCYFKIIDGYLSIKAERYKSQKKVITADGKISEGLYAGKKIGWFRDKLQEDFRNAFAHFYYGGEKTTISPDNMDNIFYVFEMIASAHDVARQVIQDVLDADQSNK